MPVSSRKPQDHCVSFLRPRSEMHPGNSLPPIFPVFCLFITQKPLVFAQRGKSNPPRTRITNLGANVVAHFFESGRADTLIRSRAGVEREARAASRRRTNSGPRNLDTQIKSRLDWTSCQEDTTTKGYISSEDPTEKASGPSPSAACYCCEPRKGTSASLAEKCTSKSSAEPRGDLEYGAFLAGRCLRALAGPSLDIPSAPSPGRHPRLLVRADANPTG
nr:hypothetical protein Iba_chr11bCG6890 [Ipomoea batatas]